jgi:MFS family permease
MLLPSLATSVANIGLPPLAQAFATSFQAVQWVVLAYLLAVTALIVCVGRLGDILGVRRLLVSGIFLFTAASALCGVASELWQLLAARALQGLGAAVMMALTTAFVGDVVPKERAGSVMGLLGSMSALGTTLGPSLGGVLIWAFDWQAIFLVNVPLGILTGLLALRFLPEGSRKLQAGRSSFDYAGTLLLVSTLTAYALAMTLGRGDFGLLNAAMLVATAVGASLFVLVEARAATPLIRLEMFRGRRFRAGIAMNALVSTVMMATLVVGPFYLSRALVLDAVLVGLVVSVGPLVATLTGVPAGRMVDQVGGERTAVGGLAGMTVGLLLLSFSRPTLGVPGYVIPIVLVTASYAMFQAANNTAVMADIPPEQRGVVSGILNLSRNLGLITGASVMGAIFAMGAAPGEIATANPESISRGVRVTFEVCVILMVCALFLASHAGLHRRQDPT